MGRKILISTLGVTIEKRNKDKGDEGDRYTKANYRFDNSEEYRTPFIAAALSQHLKVDKIVLIGTGRSMWGEVYRYFNEKLRVKPDEDYWFDIESKSLESNYRRSKLKLEDLDKLNETVDKFLKSQHDGAIGGTECLLLKYGLNQEEIWENFDRIMKLSDNFENGDEIYLDITHSFRSIPLFLYLMMNFVDTLGDKKIKLKGLYYGMLDATRDLKNDGKDYTPVVDLSSLYNISKLATGTHTFLSYGDGLYLAETLHEIMDIDESEKDNLIDISNLLNINYLVDLKEKINFLAMTLKSRSNKEGQDHSYGLKYIEPSLRSFIKRLANRKNNSTFQLELSGWFFENRRYASGYICLAESIITKYCEVFGLEIDNYNDRELAKDIFRGIKPRVIMREYSEMADVFNVYNEVSKIRNQIAHASFVENEEMKSTICKSKEKGYKRDLECSKEYYTILQREFNSKNFDNIGKNLDKKKLERLQNLRDYKEIERLIRN